MQQTQLIRRPGIRIEACEEDERTWLHIRRLKALANLHRWRIVQVLLVKEDLLCVKDLEVLLAPLSQPTISHHLRILSDVGILHCRKRGLYSYYYVKSAALSGMQEDLKHLLSLSEVQVLEETVPQVPLVAHTK